MLKKLCTILFISLFSLNVATASTLSFDEIASSPKAADSLKQEVTNYLGGDKIWSAVWIDNRAETVFFYQINEAGKILECTFNLENKTWGKPYINENIDMPPNPDLWAPAEFDWAIIPKVIQEARNHKFQVKDGTHKPASLDDIIFDRHEIIIRFTSPDFPEQTFFYTTDAKGKFISATLEDNPVE